jgi:hypothetical protein
MTVGQVGDRVLSKSLAALIAVVVSKDINMDREGVRVWVTYLCGSRRGRGAMERYFGLVVSAFVSQSARRTPTRGAWE